MKLLWPCAAYIVGTWDYAIHQARTLANNSGQRVWVYRDTFQGKPVWVFSYDPKNRTELEL